MLNFIISAVIGMTVIPAPAPADADNAQFGIRGFTGVTPEPVETPSTRPAAVEEPASRTATRPAAPQENTAPAPQPQTTVNNTRPSGGVLGIAASYVGAPYRLGGTTPAAFDCSGYTSYVFRQVGVNLPRSAAQQQAYATPVSSPSPGDLVFWGYPAWHVGIYAGDGMVYDAGNPRTGVTYRSVFSGVTGYGRVL